METNKPVKKQLKLQVKSLETKTAPACRACAMSPVIGSS